MAGFVGHFEFTVNCQIKPSPDPVVSRVVKGDFFYPFNDIKLYPFASEDKLCANETEDKASEENLDIINYKSESEYFVFTGVVSMLFVIVALVYYVLFEDRAKEATSTDVGLFSFPVVVSLLLIFVTQSINNNYLIQCQQFCKSSTDQLTVDFCIFFFFASKDKERK